MRLMKCTRIEDDCLNDFWRSRHHATTRNAAVINNIPKRHKGEMMRKHCVRILSVFFGLAAAALTVQGQAADQLVVKIPYEFVVAGKTLPAGTYRVNRVSDYDERALAISSFENRVAVVVIPSEVIDRSGAEQPSVSFQQVGEQHLLSKIATADHVFAIPVSNAAVL
jgi:hypothetical protein